MDLIRFTKNHDDLSTDLGFQFKFYCDHCHNGFLTPFETSTSGVAGTVLRTAGNLFGGFLGNIGSHSYDLQRAVGGPAHDAALRRAVEAAKQHFKQCSRCGRWVCPDHCWNAGRGLCEHCAPDVKEELAAAQAHAAKDQIWDRARRTDQVAGLDASPGALAACPKCGAPAKGSKFCSECGAAFAARKSTCPACSVELDAGSKFCPECGHRMG